jgi:hypothetical protein
VQWVRFIAADTGGIGNGVQGWFDIQNGVLGTFSTRGTGWTAVSRAITAFANGWYRLTLVYTTGAVTQNILLNSTSADNNATRVAGSAYWLWGFQDELGAFPSSPIVTVAAAATRAADVLSYTVNTTAQINAAVAGQPELVTNGGFATDSDWTKGTGWTIGSGVATKAAGSSSAINQTAASFTAGQLVALTVTISGRTAGSLYWRIGNTTNIGIMSVNGTITQILPASATGTYLGLFADATFDGTIDNVSVKEVPANSLTLYPLQLWSEFERAVDTGGQEGIFAMDDGGVNNGAGLRVDTSDRLSLLTQNGGVTQAAVSVVGLTAPGTYKIAGRIATDNINACLNGTLGANDTSCINPATATLMRVGANLGSGSSPFQYIRRIAVIQGAGTDAQLQTTTS